MLVSSRYVGCSTIYAATASYLRCVMWMGEAGTNQMLVAVRMFWPAPPFMDQNSCACTSERATRLEPIR